MIRVSRESPDVSNEKSMQTRFLPSFLSLLTLALLVAAQATPSHAQTVQPEDASGVVGDTVTVPIQVGDLSGQGVTSYQFTASVDPAALDIIGVSAEGTLSSDGLLEANVDREDGARVAYAQQDPLSGSGTLLELTVVLEGAGPSQIAIENAGFFDSEGQPVNINTAPGTVASNVAVSLPEVRGTLGIDTSLEIPVRVAETTGADAGSFEFTLTYDPDVIEVTGASTDGTLSESGTLEFNTTAPGEVRVAFASSAAIADGPGTLVVLEANLVELGESALSFDDTFQLFARDGTPIGVEETNGTATVAEPARAQVIHNAADPAAEVVDVYLDGDLLIDDFEFRTATPFVDVPAGVEVNVGVAPGNSSSVADTLANFPLTFEPNATHTVVANGVLTPGDFQANPSGESIAFDLLVATGARETGQGEGVDVRAVHGATDAPVVDIDNNGTTLFDDVTYGDISVYLEAPAQPLRLVITPGDADTPVAAFQADLSGLGGGAATVLASGFLTPSDDQNGPAFGLIAVLPNGDVVSFPANQPPTFTQVPSGLSVQPFTEATGTVAAEDPDGDPVTLSLADAPDDATLADGQFAFTPTLVQAGSDVAITVRASDGVASTDSTFTVTVEELVRDDITADLNIDFGDATNDANYEIVGLPGQANVPVNQTLTGDSGDDWRVFRDDGSTDFEDALVEFDGSDAFNFRPGRGFWVLARNPLAIQETFSPVPLDPETGEASIALNSGWNIVSNPLGKNVAWSSVQSVNGFTQPLFTFSDGAFQTVQTFSSAQNGQAYYFLNEGGLNELRIPFFEPSSTQQNATASKDARILTLRVKDGDVTRSSVWLGMRSDAKSDRDQYDHFAPPNHFSKTSLRLANPEIESPYSLISDLRPAGQSGQSYNLTLQTEPGKTLSLDVEGLDQFSGQEVQLYSQSEARTIDLRATPSPELTPANGEGSYVLLIGDASYVDSKRADLTPQELQLRQNYPNPFQGETTVSFALPEDSDVEVVVYDILGRRVRTLVDDKRSAGVHEVQWNGLNELGQPVASGMYIAQMTAGNTTRTIKMTVIR